MSDRERGSILLFVALALTTLLVIVGLAADTGLLVYARSQAQAAVDLAALSAASGIPDYVQTGSTTTISSRLSLLNSANDVRGRSASLSLTGSGMAVDLLHFDQTSRSFTCGPGCAQSQVNSIRVTKKGYDVPVFFGALREDFGAAAKNSQRLDVSATAYLGCPDEVNPPPGGGFGLGPLALRECKIGYPDTCNVSQVIQSSSSPDNSQFTTYNLKGSNDCRDIASGLVPNGLNTTVKIGDTINTVGSGQSSACLKALDDRYQHCTAASCVDPVDKSCVATLPVIDCAGSESTGVIQGFATVCFVDITSPPQPKSIKVVSRCKDSTDNPGGGQCFGLVSTHPILIN